jgi:hypothetical protein
MSLKRIRLGFETLESRQLLSGATASTLSTVYVHVPDDLTGQPGGQVVAPVDIDNASGVRGVEIRINYDTALLDASDASVQPGSLWPQGSATQIVVSVDDTAGTIVAQVFTAEGLSAVGGSLLDVHFSISSGATVGQSTAVDLAKVRINEGEIVPNPEPQPGPDSTDGKITFVSPADTGSISGFVYADTNNNNQPDNFEGVPRVKIVLVSTDGSPQRETYTDDNGRYEFDGLAAGTYSLQEQQPAALLDGGPNEISAQLADGQTLADQNFRERGLAPQYVFNRLFTTLALPVGSTNWTSAIRTIVNNAGSVATGSQAVSAQAAVKSVVATAVKPVAAAAKAVVTSAKAVVTSAKAVVAASRPAAKPALQQPGVSARSACYLAGASLPTRRLRAIDLVVANLNLRSLR